MIKILREVKKEELIDFMYNIDINDSKLYDEVRDKNSIGIFQISGKTATEVKEQVKPKNFAELNAISALARPGTIDFVDEYVKSKNGELKKYPEIIDNLLIDSSGIVLFQEQLMSIFNKIGGFSLEETNYVRGLMKKLGKADKKPEDLKSWSKVVKRFIKNSEKNNLKKTDAEFIADDLMKMSSYSFNKSHSSSYTYISIMTLYLSVYFRKYFYSSILDYEVDRDKYLLEAIHSIKNHGYEIIPPDINGSGSNIVPGKNNKILFGLMNIKYVGEKAVEVILANKPYNSVIDFILKTRDRSVTSRVIVSLISVGSFDKMYLNRKKLIVMFERFWKEKKSVKIHEKLKALWEKINEETNRIPGLSTTITDLRNYEKEYFGMCLFTSLFTKDRIDAFKAMKKQNLIHLNFEDVTLYSMKTPVCLNYIRAFKDKNQNEMAFVDIEDINGNVLSVPVFASYWKHVREHFIPNSVYLMNLYKDDNGKTLFGQRAWTRSEFTILRMIKKL